MGLVASEFENFLFQFANGLEAFCYLVFENSECFRGYRVSVVEYGEVEAYHISCKEQMEHSG